MLFAEATGPVFFNLVPWIVFFPVIGLLINIIIGHRFNEKFIGTVASLASGLALVVSVLLWISLRSHPEPFVVPFLEWISIGDLDINWAFQVDTLSVTMMLVVSGIGTLIHIYAAGYMYYDVRYKIDAEGVHDAETVNKQAISHYRRFFVYMNLFIAAMMILVSGDSYLMLFVGWEGVGLCSYLLIGFWTSFNPDGSVGEENSQAGKKAFVANRIGDFGFLIAMFITFWQIGTLTFSEVFTEAEHLAPELAPWVIPTIALFMLLGVTGKSAQIPLFVWLPDAMAGPTPVSALIHAATMVTAGVYLITRSAPLFELSHDAMNIVAWVGGLTALFAATIAVGQFDIKKVLAYSTVSQLGFMVAAVGLGGFVAGMFHLVTHAFFKALLFLGSGSLILGLERGHHPLASAGDDAHGHAPGHDDHHDDHSHPFDPQDMRNMGGMRKSMPVTFWVYMAGTLALAGIFPFAGFWSKDEILADAFAHNQGVYWLLAIAAFFTAFYMGRQIFMVFFGESRTDAAKDAKESPLVVTIPLMVLAALSVLGGALNIPGIEPINFKGPHSFAHWLEYTLGEFAHVPEYMNLGVAGVSTLFAIVALVVAWIVYGRSPLSAGQKDPLQLRLGRIFTGMYNKWYIDEIYQAVILTPYMKLAAWLADKLDWAFWHDWFHDSVIGAGFRGLAKLLAEPIDLGVVDRVSAILASGTQYFSKQLSRVQNGYVRNYALSVFMGVVIIVSYLIFR